MIQTCPICNKVIYDGDRVITEIAATYRQLKSTVHYALSKEDMEVIGPLIHEECDEERA